MPSPIGHLLAGVAVAWSAPLKPSIRLTVACAALAALPDADLLFPPQHRTATHSVASVLMILIIATAVTGWVTGQNAWRIGVVCAAAWGSHIVLDWLGADDNPPLGLQAWWPFSDTWFMADVSVFRGTERRDPLSLASILKNAKAVGQEIALLGSIVAALWFARIRYISTGAYGQTIRRNGKSTA